MDPPQPKQKWPKMKYCISLSAAIGSFFTVYFILKATEGSSSNLPLWDSSDLTSQSYNLQGAFQFTPKYVSPQSIYYVDHSMIKKQNLLTRAVTDIFDTSNAKIDQNTAFKWENWYVGWDDNTKTESFVLLQGYSNRSCPVSPTTSVVYLYYLADPSQPVDIGSGTPVQCCAIDPLKSRIAFVKGGDLWMYDGPAKTSSVVKPATSNGPVATYPWMIRQELGDKLAAWWSNGALLYADYDLSNVTTYPITLVQYPNQQQFTYDYPLPGEHNPQLTLTLVTQFDPPVESSWALGDDYLIQVVPFYDSAAFALKTFDRSQQNVTLSYVSSAQSERVVIDTQSTSLFYAANATMLMASGQKLLDIVQQPISDNTKHQSQIVLYDLTQSNSKTVLRTPRPGEEITKIVGYASDDSYTFISTYSNQTNPPPAGTERVIWSVSPLSPTAQPIASLHPVYHDAWSNADYSFVLVQDLAYSPGSDGVPKTRVYQVGAIALPIDLTQFTTAEDAFKNVSSRATPQWEFDDLFTEDVSVYDTVHSVNVAFMKPPSFDKNRRYPVIVAFPDHPGQQLVSVKWPFNTERMRWFTYMCSNLNYVIVLVDAHGADGRGYDFLTSIYQNLGAETTDYQTVIQTIQTYSWVNPKQVSLMGWNYGAGLALLTASRYSDIIHSVVAVAPTSGWQKTYNMFAERYLGPAGTSVYNRSSVYLNLANGKPLNLPLVLVQGTADTVVHVESAYDFQQILQTSTNAEGTRFYVNLDNNLYVNGAVNKEFYTFITNFFNANIKYNLV